MRLVELLIFAAPMKKIVLKRLGPLSVFASSNLDDPPVVEPAEPTL